MHDFSKLYDGAREVLVAWERSKPSNFLDADPNLQRVLRMHLGEAYHVHWPLINRAAALAATRMDDLAREVDRDEHMPLLRKHDPLGNNLEEVLFHAAHYQLGALIWSTGVLAVLKEPGADVLGGALTYLISHIGEAGHVCPVACTAGLIKLMQTVGDERQKEQYLPQLLQTDYSRRLHASQFITEVQGGSDVGANLCFAEQDPKLGLYRISGEKWFCSVADAGVFVVSARVPGGAKGTDGVGLFLVPRMINDRVNGFTIRRLKPKLGTRSLATAEIEFNQALAEPLGPLSDGFRRLVGVVLTTSRVHNAVAACGMMRRAFVEAQTFAQYRKAFGGTLINFPLVQLLMARMKTLTTAATAGTFRLLALGDDIDTERNTEAYAPGARRILVMINKYWTARLCSDVVRMGIEVLGGNGTIEDFSVLPRLYRDAIVLESWEGSHNTLCAQVLRDFVGRALHVVFMQEMDAALRRVVHAQLEDHAKHARGLYDKVQRSLERLLVGDMEQAALLIRSLVDRMCVLNAHISLMLELQWELDNGKVSSKPDVLTLFRHWQVDRLPLEELPGVTELIKRLALTFG